MFNLISGWFVINVILALTYGQQSSNDACVGIAVSSIVADPEDCTKFFQCNENSVVHGSCPSGMFYHSVDVCSFDATDCRTTTESVTTTSIDVSATPVMPSTTASTTPKSTTSGTTFTPAPTLPEIDTTTEGTTVNPEAVCLESDPNKPRFVKSSTNCSQYYICVNRMPILHSCVDGKYWNDEHLYCDDPRRVPCGQDAIETPVPLCQQASATDVLFTGSPTSCDEYYICIQQKPFLMHCAPGTHWNDSAKQCQPQDEANCKATNTAIDNINLYCPSSGEVFTGHPQFCELFLFCQNGKASVQRCPFLTDWDSFAERCVPRTSTTCRKRRLY
ncbi:probable chitinase 10 [Anopheles bellator]|uniref:probable chitinase 10 n=1 Tax=Anopheles bellator TaxID=139047 RepID=UPI00264978CE|nr:probable chitinase 10 [Anopheles bellator]